MPYNTLVSFTAGNTLAAADLNNNFANSDYLRYMVNAQFILPASFTMGNAGRTLADEVANVPATPRTDPHAKRAGRAAPDRSRSGASRAAAGATRP